MPTSSTQDELDIRTLIANYTDAVNRNDLDGAAAVYAEDASLVAFSNPAIVGRAAIRQALGQTIAAFQWIFQMTHSGLVRVDGDSASCRFWVTESGVRLNGSGSHFSGLYQDQVIRTAEGWRFSKRQLDAIFLGRVTFEGKTFAPPVFTPGLSINF